MKLIKDYNKFITEKFDSVLESYLLLESNVIYSNEFRKVLTKMGDNDIAKRLLEIENKDLEVLSNFFDLKPDNDNFITFTLDRIAQDILKKKYVIYNGGGVLTNNFENNKEIFEPLGYVPKSTEIYKPGREVIGEVVSKFKSEKTGKTWVYVKFKDGEGVYNEAKLSDGATEVKNTIFKKSRQEIRTGRAIRLLLTANKITVPDSEIEKFVNDFKATIKIANDVFSNFEIVEGDALGFWYHRKNYLQPHDGSLGSSCQAVGRLDWLQIYIQNPQTVKLLILKSDKDPNKIIGRALIWNLDNGGKLMDYVYTSNDSDEKIFYEYATSKGWENRNSGETFVAHIKPIRFDKYPSIDTMYNWEPDTGKISNRSFAGSEHLYWTDRNDDDAGVDADENGIRVAGGEDDD